MRIPGWLFLTGAVMLVFATVLCSFGSYTLAHRVASDLGRSGVQISAFDSFAQTLPTATSAPQQTATMMPTLGGSVVGTVATTEPTQAVEVTLEPTATPDSLAAYTWDDPRRINLLLLGIDQRDGVADEGYYLTDTIIIASIDPVRETVGLLSIPRDLWVQIPGYQYGRINTANQLGDQGAYPGGGPALLSRTITENLGINIDSYVLINFNVFLSVTNLVAPNGVEVCPTETIDDPDYPDGGYGTIHVHFEAGCQRLAAEQLLQYARTRATEGSDFDRARRQQEVILALRQEVLSAGGIVNFLTSIPSLWTELSNNYRTNLTLEQVIALGNLAQQVDTANIRTGQIDQRYTNFTTLPSGEQVLVPRYSVIRTLLQDVFEPQTTLTLSELRQRSEDENATIVVFNNTDISGLASQTRDWLASRQVTITSVGNTSNPTGEPTTIRYTTDKVWTARYLAALMGLSSDRIQPGADGLTTEDIAVIVGTDIQPLFSNPGQ